MFFILLNQNSNSKIPSTIDKILEINRSNSSANVLPQNIETKNIGSFNWRSIDKNSMEFYLDFETMNSNFFDILFILVLQSLDQLHIYI